MKNIRFAIAQLNPAAGDYSANTKKMMNWIGRAERQKADLIAFPECSLSGYPVWDLANKQAFVEDGLAYLSKIIKFTAGLNITVAMGFIDKGTGKRSSNSMAWFRDGKLIAKQIKRLLPTYDVFLEDIFFEPGKESKVIKWNGMRIGPTICEDIWDLNYSNKPLQDLAEKKPDFVLNISASPYFRGVAEVRDGLLKKHTRQYGFPMLYVNQVGAQDDLIFDGRSLFVDEKGNILFRAPAFEEGVFIFDWKKKTEGIEVPLPYETSKPAEVYQALVLGIRDYCKKNNFQKVVIGLSGGIDSALVASLAADALGRGAVLGVTMPGTYSSKGSWEDAESLAKNLGIEFRVRPIRKKYHFFLKEYFSAIKNEGGKLPARTQITLAMENLQARLRGLELMFISNDERRMLLTTGNKSELAMGYCTLYGDMAGGLCVLGDVYKTDVYRLAKYRNSLGHVIPVESLTKAPSAELRPNQKDEDSLPPYKVLDKILFDYIEKNDSPVNIAKKLKGARIKVQRVKEIIHSVDHNEYKRRQTPPILRVTEKAWFGRRMPITNRYKS